MMGVGAEGIRSQARFRGISPGEDGKGCRNSKGMSRPAGSIYGERRESIAEGQAFDAGPDGSQVRKLEGELAGFLELGRAVAVCSGEDALHLALKLAAWKLYGLGGGARWPDCRGGVGISMPDLPGGRPLRGQKVFCQDLAAMDLAGAVLAMGGEPVFIDSSETGWAISPEILDMAFRSCPDAKIAIMDHVYGFPGDAPTVRRICDQHNALLIECAGEALGAEYLVPQGNGGGSWVKAGTLGDYCVLGFGEGRVLGIPGGALLIRDWHEAEKARHWAGGTKAVEPRGLIEDSGCDFALGYTDAAVLRGQLAHISEMIGRKKAVYQKYYDSLDGQMAYMIAGEEGIRPNYWMSCMTSESEIQFMETRGDRGCKYLDIHGTAAPMEICEALSAFGAGCGAVYKPMSMHPAYRSCGHFTLDGDWRLRRGSGNTPSFLRRSRARAYFESGVVLPSDISMTDDEQDRIIDIIYACYDKSDINRLMWTA